MIDAWKNTLKDPFFFVKLDHINSYNHPEYCSNQGYTLLVLAYCFFPSIFDFDFLRCFLLYCPNLFPIELDCLFLVQIPSILSSKGVEGVGACLCTWYSPIHSHTLVFAFREIAFVVLFRDISFYHRLLHSLNPAYRRKSLLSRKHLHVTGCPYLFFWWRNQTFSRFLSSFTLVSLVVVWYTTKFSAHNARMAKRSYRDLLMISIKMLMQYERVILTRSIES